MILWRKKVLAALKEYRYSANEADRIILDHDLFYLLIAANFAFSEKDIVVVTHDMAATEAIANDLGSIYPLFNRDTSPPPDQRSATDGDRQAERAIHILPELEDSDRFSELEKQSERSRLYHSIHKRRNIYCTSILSLLQPTPDPRQFQQKTLDLSSGTSEWPPEKLSRYLVDLDYDNEFQVSRPGEFSWRGGILDIFSPAYDYPVRLDYWGNTIDSMRFFDPVSQRSVRDLKHFEIVPRSDRLWSESKTSDSYFLDYFENHSPILIFCEFDRIENHFKKYGHKSTSSYWASLLEWPGEQLFLYRRGDPQKKRNASTYECPFFSLSQLSTSIITELETSSQTLHLQYLKSHLKRWAGEKTQVVLCTSKASIQQRFKNMLTETSDLKTLLVEYENFHLPCGVFFPQLKVALLSEPEVFGKPKVTRRRVHQQTFHTDQMIHSGTELNIGDFAVHAVHGICRYLGLKLERFHDRTQEVLVLEFGNEVNLFVPLEQSCLVSAYIGSGKKLPKLSKIGGASWNKARHAAFDAVADLASELIKIQAVRESSRGFSFDAADNFEMINFNASFLFEETKDQKDAIDAVSNDMSKARPMDRLICGDVGYGKTEVAMRAACNAVLCGKQVALLVPTTILAQQHYLTFCDRFKELPVLIEALSRFRSGREQTGIIKALADGKIDIIIGTHRLLQSDIRFKDLGVIIIDEEQRFGVRDKERLKKMRADVDVLTMTATPIPRTLYLSMAGLRDMSTIMTAPHERLPVQTMVMHYDVKIIQESINREIQRGGQVFYLHNRVGSIQAVWERLSRLFPQLSIDIAHGRMPESELESAMVRFIEGKTDILVCTTIIESGLDIPNANTIIIERADRFGLAELYQLRGRVGRYHRQAYAYLLLPKEIIILNSAKERLAAIQKYTQLGAGFKLALRDLEIRGAGNVLGAEQSGHISAVGFNLYCQLLKEAVSRLQNKPSPAYTQISLELDFLIFGTPQGDDRLSAEIPPDFIEDNDLRLECYRRLGVFQTVSELDDFTTEIRDRFGQLPESFNNLLKTTKLKILSGHRGVTGIKVINGKIVINTAKGYWKNANNRFPRLKTWDYHTYLDQLIDLVEHRSD